MKLSLVLLLATFMQVSAATYAQKLNLSLNEVSLEKAFKIIRKQSGFNILYNPELVAGASKVNAVIRDGSIEEVMTNILRRQALDYTIVENNIIIVRKAKALSSKQSAAVISVTGKVSDEKGQPLPGVSVKIKNTQTAVISNNEGIYRINVPDENTVLVFTYMGFVSQERLVGSNTEINVSLAPEISKLSEVVVIGYGTVNRRDLTGAVSSIKSEEIARSKVSSFQEAIQGKLAGVQISSVSGEPGAALNISIRGANSIYGGTSPLFVIDGIPYDAGDNAVGTASVGVKTQANPLASINPNDIESIDVLKDASSTAIYGSRGANGVIIVTTKSGKAGAPKIDYEGFTSFSTITKKLGVLSADEYIDYRRVVGPNTIFFYNDTNKDGLYNELDQPVDPNTYQKHDWQDETLKTGISQNHNISLNGKKDRTSYAAGLGYLDQGAIVRNNAFKRYSGRLRLDQDFSDRLKVGLNLNTTNTGASGASQSGGGSDLFNGVVQNLIISKPVEFYDPVFDRGGAFISPVTMIDNAYKENSTVQDNVSAYLNYKFIPGLTLNISGGGILTTSKTKEFYGKKTSWGVGDNGLGIIQDQKATTLFNTNQLTYERWINQNHYLNVMVASQINQNTYEWFSVQKSNFMDESTGIDDISKGTTAKGSGSFRDVNRRLSYFGRLNYTLLTRHLFTATFRADGSDKFGKENRFGYFPSFAYAWLASEEKFLKGNDFLSKLKMRLTYGQTGNERIESFRYLARLENSFYNGELGLAPGSSQNRELKWENTTQYNAGLDVGLFKNRLELTLDYYSKRTNDMLLPAYVPGRTGYNTQWQNLGRVDNKGLEIQISSRNIQTKDFDWQTNFNISGNRNKVRDIGNIGFIPITMSSGWIQDVGRVTVGQPIGTAYGYEFDGVYQLDEFTWQNSSDANIPHDQRLYAIKEGVTKVAGVNVAPGSFKFKDLNGDGIIDLDNDRTTISQSAPKFFGGFNNTFRYKNFDLNVFFEGSYGAEIFNASRYQLEGGVLHTYMNISKDFFHNRWSPTNPTNEYGDFGSFNKTATLSSSYYVEDASYLRLKNVLLAYRIPDRLAKTIGVGSARVYVSGSNLITWTNYTGFDPEIQSENALLPGFDRLSYPRAKVYTIGLNVGF